MKQLISLFLFMVFFNHCGKTKCEKQCEGSSVSCIIFLSSIFSYTPSTTPETSTISEKDTLINGTFDKAEKIQIPYTGSQNFNGYISSGTDTDIYYMNSSSGTGDFELKLTNGSPVCNMYLSSVIAPITTDIAAAPLVDNGILNASVTNISLNSSKPYLYIKCTSPAAQEYSFNMATKSVKPATNNSMLLLAPLLCGTDASCTKTCENAK